MSTDIGAMVAGVGDGVGVPCTGAALGGVGSAGAPGSGLALGAVAA